MLTSNRLRSGIIGAALLGIVALGAAVDYSRNAGADSVFMTRIGQVISLYPRSNALSIGTTTANGQAATTTIGKLNVTLNPGDVFLGAAREGFLKAFQISSTTTNGGTATSTADIFSVYNNGCVGMAPTSSATQVKLKFLTVGTTSANGFVTWSYGTCP